jgi:hypothetical protein
MVDKALLVKAHRNTLVRHPSIMVVIGVGAFLLFIGETCCATIKNRPSATIGHTPHGRASSPKGSTVKPAAAGGGGQIGQALRAISSVSIIDCRCYYTAYPFSAMKA